MSMWPCYIALVSSNSHVPQQSASIASRFFDLEKLNYNADNNKQHYNNNSIKLILAEDENAYFINN